MGRRKGETLNEYRKRRGKGNKWKLNSREYRRKKQANRKRQGLKK